MFVSWPIIFLAIKIKRQDKLLASKLKSNNKSSTKYILRPHPSHVIMMFIKLLYLQVTGYFQSFGLHKTYLIVFLEFKLYAILVHLNYF